MTFCRDLSVSRGVASDREHSLAFTRSGEVVEGIGTLPINRRHSNLCVCRFLAGRGAPKNDDFVALPCPSRWCYPLWSGVGVVERAVLRRRRAPRDLCCAKRRGSSPSTSVQFARHKSELNPSFL